VSIGVDIDELCVPAVRLPTVGHRAFPVSGARI